MGGIAVKLLRKEHCWLGLGAMMTLLPFLPLLSAGFLNYDDPDYVTANPHLFNGLTLQFVQWAFAGAHSCNWHPLTWFSHLLDLKLFWFDPAGHHLTSVLLHVANFSLLATLLWRSTGIFWPSLVVGFLFGIHPLHVESVAWVAERKDVLSTFFFFATMHAYLSFVRERTKISFLFAILFFSLGLLAKPMVVTLPLVLLLIDYWPLRRKGPLYPLLVEKIPFFLLAAASCVATFVVQNRCGAVITSPGTFWQNAGNAVISYSIYLGKTAWPTELAFIYPFRAEDITLMRVGGSLLVIFTISAVVALFGKTRPYLTVGWCWYLVTLIPVIGFVRVGDQAMADRYTYVPLVGIFIAVVWQVWSLINGNRLWGKRVGAATLLLLLVIAVATWKQCGYWENGVILNRHAVEVTGDNWAANYNLGAELNAAGDVEGGIRHYLEAARLFPEHGQIYFNLGKIYLSMDNAEEAIRYFTIALARGTAPAEARLNLGYALIRAGRADLAQLQHSLLLKEDRTMAEALQESIRIATGKPPAGAAN